ncbi:glycosyltransferase family 1 protein [Dysgonomonas sp. 520]|uniref:glycosyltransferase family 4 protein n=1 Tax=Dysgonomonas sp. 520 TaxID=2302931 RepID=UPI0013D22563|nr:glycosyltransferase family 1 protein [Dysgonomonas sp. 520]NDW09009.1 glycosyltransferase family 1 protein [Dysgonomonas sp. 520]
MKVCYIYRQKSRNAHSIENVFQTISDNIEALGIESVSYYRNDSLLKTFREVRKLKADIYHITGDVYYLAMFLPPKKTIMTIHDIGRYKNRKKSLKNLLYALLWFLIPTMRVRKITVVSELVKNDLIKYFKVKENKISIIPNPLVQKLSYSERKNKTLVPNVLQIGTGEHKNLIGLIEAVKGLKCNLTIIGHIEEKIDHLLKLYGIEYKNYNDITNEEVVKLYELCDIVYFASFSEGFGLPILEGQAIGRAVITSNISPMKEVSGEAVLLVNPYDIQQIREALTLLMTNEETYNELVKLGLRNVSKYDILPICQKYVSAYNSLKNM